MAESKKILMLDGNSSQCLPLMRSFYKKGYWVTLVSPSKFSSGYFSKYANEKLIWPKITGNEDEFYGVLLKHIKSTNYDVVLGLSDVSSGILSYHKSEVEKYVSTVVPDYQTFSIAANKYATMQLCMKNEIPCPLTFDDNEAYSEELKKKLNFPAVVKPKKGVGAIGFTVVDDWNLLVQKLPGLRKKFGSLLIQEYIPNQMQYTVEAFCDKNSELKACVISKKERFFPVDGGTSSCNITVDEPEIVFIVENLLNKLEWKGIANIDFVFDPRDNTHKVIEINPRIGATAKIAFMAGIDLSEMLLKLANDEVIEEKRDYNTEIILRNLLLEMLWFLFSSFKNKRRAQTSFFKFFGRNVSYQSFGVDDPSPLIGFVLGYIVKYADLKKLKEKLPL